MFAPLLQAAAAKGKGAKAGTKRGRGGSKAADEPAEVTAAGAAGPRRRVFVVVLDEVDRLLRRRDGGEDLARLFQLPSAPGKSIHACVTIAVGWRVQTAEPCLLDCAMRGVAAGRACVLTPRGYLRSAACLVFGHARAGVSLVLLAVANSLDLTERMMPLLRSRGLAPRHMVFTAYSRPQVRRAAGFAPHPHSLCCEPVRLYCMCVLRPGAPYVSACMST